MNKDPLNNLPQARKDKLIIKDLSDETLVYDLESDKAHCLNQTAASIWKNCDGNHTVTDLMALLAADTKSKVPDEVVWLALDQLEKFDLLEETPELPPQFAGMNRRELVRRIGIGVLALPLIVSISASPAQAQGSLLAPGRCCGNPTDCASNNCAQTPTCVSPPPPAPSTKACA
ncbi:MAG: PqqD family protein [Pyrinomonadaceae bacterium]